MNTLVLYDSNFGNTKLIAEEIAKNIGASNKVVSTKQFKTSDLENIDLLIVGSPIVAWNPTQDMQPVLDLLKNNIKNGLKYTTFDTRVKLFIHGDAKEKISQALSAAGGKLVFEPQAFYVSGKKGPLFGGELEKAANWAKMILTKI